MVHWSKKDNSISLTSDYSYLSDHADLIKFLTLCKANSTQFGSISYCDIL
jgi:hypothetical protein